jgi:hypothetical protein
MDTTFAIAIFFRPLVAILLAQVRNALVKEGSKSDRIDARKLAELLRSNMLRSMYHGEHGARKLKEPARSYLAISKDLGRVMSRVKAIYAPRYRSESLGKIQERTGLVAKKR